MEKKICAFIFTLSFIGLSTIVQGQSSNIKRTPSVEPLVEVEIENAKSPTNVGYDFSTKTRIPANITSKTSENKTMSVFGPIIFLIALPIGLWIMISKKLSHKNEEKTIDYYPKTYQFTPYKTEYQKSADEEEDGDDMDFPKAS